jgi:hypothetical protein
MSASPLKADMRGSHRHGDFVPIAAICAAAIPSLFDHLVGAGEQRREHVKTKCLRAFQIDYQLVFGGPLHGKVGRLLTLENAVDVISCVYGLTDDFRSIRDQAADGNEVSRCEDRTSEREARQAGERNAEARSLRETDAALARSANLAHRLIPTVDR